MTRRLTYVEIDIDYCALNYGVSPCTASIPATGDIKCFNSIATCQDPANFDNHPVTLRFGIDVGYLPREIACIPSLTDVALTPATLELGEGLGTRGSISVTFKDHRHPDTGAGFDKYVSERPYDAFAQGSFWGKFRARQPFLRGRPLRLIRGEVGEALGDMETRHFVIESFDGPRPDGMYTLIAKDILKLADDDRAQAPRASNGFLVGNINNSETGATLSPTGIGNFEYPASGYVCIGGNEVCAFTRSGDALTLTRGQLGSVAVAHNAEERVQLVLRYVGEDPADIIADLLENYANVPSAFIPLSNWQDETDAFLQRQYTAAIVEPTGVNTLITELVQQAGLGMWWDDLNQQIRLQVLRPVSQDATELGPRVNMEETLATKEQPEKRVSQVWTFYAQRDPTKPLSNEDNYKSVVVSVDAESETNYGSSAIKKIHARWIPEFGRSIAERANDLILGRYAIPPRRFDLALLRGTVDGVALGRSYHVAGWPIQDATGAPDRAPAIITRFDPGDAILRIEAEEARFGALAPVDLFDRVILIESNSLDFNLRAVHDILYPEIVDPYGITLTCIIQTGVTVGATTTANRAFSVGDWVPGVPIVIRNNGNILGRGADGSILIGSVVHPTGPAGTALYSRYPVTVENAGIIGGGGGGSGIGVIGGNRRAGGGGAGYLPGAGGIRYTSGGSFIAAGKPGNLLTGGQGEIDHSSILGGDLGLESPGVAPRGQPGNAIDGASFITFSPSGDIRGAQIN